MGLKIAMGRLSQRLPLPLKQGLKYVRHAGLDLVDWSTGKRTDPLVPSRRHNFIGDGDFIGAGDDFLKTLVEHAGLTPAQHLLDIGSGQGRMARPLTQFLSPQGSYSGVEVVRRGVEWCDRAYRGYDNFRFYHADIYNRFYNPDGGIKAYEYQLPFDDNSFDLVFLASVFTHMYPVDIERYINEISRCLKPGGRVLATYFLLFNESRASLEAGTAALDFRFPVGENAMTTTSTVPEDAIAVDESWLFGIYRSAGLEVTQEGIFRGNWVPRGSAISFQDMLLGHKTERES